MRINGLTARQWALLVDGPGATRADEQRWQRWLSGRSAMPVDALARMAAAADLGWREMLTIIGDVADRRADYLERHSSDS